MINKEDNKNIFTISIKYEKHIFFENLRDKKHETEQNDKIIISSILYSLNINAGMLLVSLTISAQYSSNISKNG